MLSVFTICCISGPLTVLTNMLCYTSLCTSSTLGTSFSFHCKCTVFSFPSSTLPINKLGLLAWVHTFHLAISCVRLGGSLTPPSFSYLRVARLGGFLLWGVCYHPIHSLGESAKQLRVLCPHSLSLGVSANHPSFCFGVCVR